MPNKADSFREPPENQQMTFKSLQAMFDSEDKLNKKLKLVYTELKPNYAAIQPITLLKAGKLGLLDPKGNPITDNDEETIFKVVAVGKHTDDYQLKIEEGDEVMIGPDMLNVIRHNPKTKVTNSKGVNMYAYVIVPFNTIIAKVKYSKM